MREPLITIPLFKLQRAKANVRKTDRETGIDELAASIIAHGLLQNLTVRRVAKANGKPTGKYEVVAGGRRLAALTMLARTRKIAKTFPVPCRVLEENDPTEISLAENVVRAPVHPADQFEAFSKLHRNGLGAEEIAARFGVTPTVVRQRLKLAAVSPRLMEVYRAGDMTLDQLTAFTVSDDHEAQEHVWFEGLHYGDPQSIKRALTRALVEGSDRRARFVGAEAYEAADGAIIRDLFSSDDDGYFTDSALLDRLVAEKLSTEAETVKAEGWAWVEVIPEMDYVYLTRFRRLPLIPLSDEDEAKLTALSEQYDSIIETVDDEPPAEIDEELSRLSAEMEQISAKQMAWPAEEKAEAGAVVMLDHRGGLHIERGLVKGEDRKGASAPEPASGASSKGDAAEKTEKQKTLSEALVADLTAHRTAALRETFAGKPELALTALLHTLALRSFYGFAYETCLEITPASVDLRPFADGIAESKAMVAVADRHRAWLDRLPKESGDLWSWLIGQDKRTKLALLAYCTATTLNAVQRRGDRPDSDRLAHATQVAEVARLDMTAWWEATKETYFSRVPKAFILAAVEEAVSPQAADNFANLKKDAMAAAAAERIAGKAWLPEILRTPSAEPEGSTDNDATRVETT